MKNLKHFFIAILFVAILTACSPSSQSEETSSQLPQETDSTQSEAVQGDEPNTDKPTNENVKTTSTINFANPAAYDSLYDVEAVEDENYLYLAYKTSDDKTVVELIDNKTNEFVTSYTLEGSILAYSLEYDATNDIVRFTTDTAIHSIKNTSASYIAMLPEYLQNFAGESRYFTFDCTAKYPDFNADSAYWAITNDDGIHIEPIGENPNEAIFISNTIIAQNANYNSESPYYFTDVKIMRDGQTIVSTIYNPMAQSGRLGIYTYHIPEGEGYFYPDVFSAMIAFASYPNDNTVIAHAYEDINVISLDFNEVQTIPAAPFTFYSSYDYINFFRTTNEEGKSYLQHLNEAEGIIDETLKEFDSDKVYILDVTKTYILLVVDGSEYIAIRYDDLI